MLWGVSLRAQLDGTWTVKVRGEVVQAEADGRFEIPNISALDSTGQGVSDDVYLIRAVSHAGATTRYAFSQPFRIWSSCRGTARRFRST